MLLEDETEVKIDWRLGEVVLLEDAAEDKIDWRLGELALLCTRGVFVVVDSSGSPVADAVVLWLLVSERRDKAADDDIDRDP